MHITVTDKQFNKQTHGHMPNESTERVTESRVIVKSLLCQIMIVQLADVVLRDLLPAGLLHMIDCNTTQHTSQNPF